MKKIVLEITGTVPLGGQPPGSRFEVEAFDDGTPTSLYWRKRLADEAACQCGAVRVVPDEAPAEPATLAAPAASAKKGR